MPKTVLIVDADVDLRTLARVAMSACRLEVFEAGTAAQARQVLTAESIDLVIIDEALPDVPGAAFIAECRATRPTQPVILLTAGTSSHDADQAVARELGVRGILHKPFAPVVFARRVELLLGPGGVGEEVEPSREQPGPAALSAAPAPRIGLLPEDFADLEVAFAGSLRERLSELSAAVEAAEADPEQLELVETLAHRIRGTAGSYGYEYVGDLAGNVEDFARQLRSGECNRSYTFETIHRFLRDAARNARRQGRISSGPSREPSQVKKALLAIDDDVDFLRLVRRYARRHSMDVITAQTVEEGLERARSSSLSAALLDIHLDQGSSLPAVQELRTACGNPHLPIIFASVDGSLATRVAAVKAGGTRFLDKPLSEQKFSELLHQLPFAEAHAARVVLVDDDPIVLERYESMMQQAGYFVRSVEEPENLVEALEDVRPDVLVMDVNLGDVSGIDICRALRASDQWQFLPILMFSADKDADMRVRAYQAGASDVLGKPLTIEELMTRVSVQAERTRLLREHSDRDTLSGLMLRRAFVEALHRSLATCRRERKELALILFDLDYFKQVNDTHGHLVGDRVIAAFGALLRKHFRLEDLRGRWGGEEFMLAFAGQGVDFAQSVAEKLLCEFSEMVFETESGSSFSVTFTAGIAVYPEDGESLDVLVKRADELLYHGKAQGRGLILSSTQTRLE